MTNLYADEALYALLCKYLLGEADATERQWVEEWLKTDASHPQLLASLDKLLTTQSRITVSPDDTERAWQTLNTRMGGKTIRQQWRGWWMAAAVMFIAAGAGLWWLTSRSSRVQRFAGPVVAQLSDGTTVSLDAKALLEVLPGFGQHNREVTLRGKATFDVSKDAAAPFTVKLGERTITVLGTRFMVEAGEGKSGTLRVHVDTGKVMVTDGGSRDSVVLSQGMMLEQQHEKDAFKVIAHVADANAKRLVFTDTPLWDVLQTIALIYNIQVTADAALQQLPVTATFTGETVDNILSSLAFMINATVEKTDAGMTLKKLDE